MLLQLKLMRLGVHALTVLLHPRRCCRPAADGRVTAQGTQRASRHRVPTLANPPTSRCDYQASYFNAFILAAAASPTHGACTLCLVAWNVP